MTRSSFLLAVLLLVPGCRPGTLPPAPTPESAAINWILTRSDSIPPDSGFRRPLPGRILLQQTTEPASVSASFLAKALPNIDSASRRAFAESLLVARRIEVAPPALPSPVILLPRDVWLARLQAPNRWWYPWKRLVFGPDVPVLCSTVYIMPDGRTALMTVAVAWGSLDAEGYVVTLTRGAQGWAVTGSTLLWAS